MGFGQWLISGRVERRDHSRHRPLAQRIVQTRSPRLIRRRVASQRIRHDGHLRITERQTSRANDRRIDRPGKTGPESRRRRRRERRQCQSDGTRQRRRTRESRRRNRSLARSRPAPADPTPVRPAPSRRHSTRRRQQTPHQTLVLQTGPLHARTAPRVIPRNPKTLHDAGRRLLHHARKHVRRATRRAIDGAHARTRPRIHARQRHNTENPIEQHSLTAARHRY